MELKFKTNINCDSCVRMVSPFLNEEQSINNWQVDTSIADKILTVETNESVDKIVAVVQDAGFEISVLN